MTVDSAKTGLPAPPKKETALAKTGLCLFRGRNRFVKAGAASRARSQYIATAKAPCQALTAAALNFFFRQDARQLFSGRRGCGVSEISADERAARLSQLRAAPI